MRSVDEIAAEVADKMLADTAAHLVKIPAISTADPPFKPTQSKGGADWLKVSMIYTLYRIDMNLPVSSHIHSMSYEGQL